jgi:hypothetical protein
MAPTTTDIVVFAICLSWTCLSLTPAALKNAAYALVIPTQEVLKKILLSSEMTFAPGLLDILQSKVPPTISYFKTLPVHSSSKLWAVYLLVLEQPGHRPKIYIGSGTNSKRGIGARLGNYRREDVLSRFVQRALDSGYKITHTGFLCWGSNPAAPERFRTRALFLLIECVFSLYFWAMVSRTKDYGMPHLCPWALDTIEYDGCYTHTSLSEGLKDIYENLTSEEMEALETEKRLKHSRRDTAKRGKEDKARGEALRIDNNRAAEKYRCAFCDVKFGTGAGLGRHLTTQKHKDKVAGITRAFDRPERRITAASNIATRLYYCKICNYAAENEHNLSQHCTSKKHLKKKALQSSS